MEQLYPNTLNIIKGYYSLDKARLLAFEKPIDKDRRVEDWKLEKKQADVNIALEAYRDVAKGDVEQCIFVSDDTDLAPALKTIRENFSDTIKIGVILPIRKNRDQKKHRPGNAQLSQYADWTRKHITAEELANNQLPPVVPTKKKAIKKPYYW